MAILKCLRSPQNFGTTPGGSPAELQKIYFIQFGYNVHDQSEGDLLIHKNAKNSDTTFGAARGGGCFKVFILTRLIDVFRFN